MCVCIHAGMHVYMHVCMYVYMHVCMYTCMYVCIHACTHVYMHVCMYIQSHTYISPLRTLHACRLPAYAATCKAVVMCKTRGGWDGGKGGRWGGEREAEGLWNREEIVRIRAEGVIGEISTKKASNVRMVSICSKGILLLDVCAHVCMCVRMHARPHACACICRCTCTYALLHSTLSGDTKPGENVFA